MSYFWLQTQVTMWYYGCLFDTRSHKSIAVELSLRSDHSFHQNDNDDIMWSSFVDVVFMVSALETISIHVPDDLKMCKATIIEQS